MSLGRPDSPGMLHDGFEAIALKRGIAHGPLAASIIVMLWLWVSAIVFLLGAGLTATVQKRWEAAELPAVV